MNQTVLLRILWKEYRQLRALWLVIAALVTFVQAVTLVISLSAGGEIPVDELFGIGLFLPMCYALGCGAALFAGEHESHTYDFQRTLPVSASRLAVGKIGPGLFSTLLMPPAMWLSAWLMSGGRLPWIPGQFEIGLAGMLVLIALFAWSVLWSLLLGRVLWAVVLSAVSAFSAATLVVPWLGLTLRYLLPAYLENLATSFALLFAFGLVMLVTDYWLGRRWLREYPLPWNRPWRERRAAAFGDRQRSSSRLFSWYRLVWQAWRQSCVNLTMNTGFPALASLLFIVHAVFFLSGPIEAFRFALFFAPAVAAFVGSTIFWADQRNGQYVFLAERGVSPRRIWASRQMIGIAAVAAYYAFALACLTGDLANQHSAFRIESVLANDVSPASNVYQVSHEAIVYQVSREAILYVFSFVGLGVVLYSVGQACSLMIRSGPVALFCGLVCGWAAGMWAGLMWHLDVPLWFSVAPIPVALLWASWLRAPDWMNERVRWRHRWKLLLSLVVPMAAVVAAVIWFRVYEIPLRQPSLSPEQVGPTVSREALKTAWAYLGADGDSKSLADYEPPRDVELAIADFLEASRRTECVFPTVQLSESLSKDDSLADLAGVVRFTSVVTRTSGFVLDSCDALEAEGRLDEALDRYFAALAFSRHFRNCGDWHRQWQADMIEVQVWQRLAMWATAAGQTPERIRGAIVRLDEEHLSVPVPRSDAIIEDYRWYRRQLDMQPDAVGLVTAQEAFAHWFASRFLPWELVRLRRLLDVSVSEELHRLEVVESALASGTALNALRFTFRDEDRQMQRWLRTTPLFRGGTLSGSTFEEVWGRCEVQRRIVRLQLELAAWQAEHGTLPETLDLLRGQESESSPVARLDPYTGAPFLYRPHGFGEAITMRPDMGLELWTRAQAKEQILPAGAPFLWSARPTITYRSRRGPLNIPREPNFGDFTYRPANSRTAYDVTSEQELWSLGQCFPIPMPAAKE